MGSRGWDLHRWSCAYHESDTNNRSLVLLHVLGVVCTCSLEALLLLLVRGEVAEVAPALDALGRCVAGVRRDTGAQCEDTTLDRAVCHRSRCHHQIVVSSFFSLLVLCLEHLLLAWSAVLNVVGHLNLRRVRLELDFSGEAIYEVGVGNLISFKGAHLNKRCILASTAT